jgi:two-component sensor histidine kinase
VNSFILFPIQNPIIDLVKGIYKSFGPGTSRIGMKIDAQDFWVGIDTAIPLGLIINELVSNVLKHAFPPGRDGEICIRLRMTDADTIELKISDNGIGFSEGLDFRKTESLGIRLVVTLSENQLRGKITLERDKGTAFRIRFREIKNTKHA